MAKGTSKLFPVPVHADERGKLTVMEGQQNVPFAIARFFAITNVPAGCKRGQHAHRTCSELLFVVAGRVSVSVETVAGKEKHELTPRSGALLLAPMSWVEMFDFSPDAVFLCLSDEHYDPKEHVSDYDEFQRLLGRRAAS